MNFNSMKIIELPLRSPALSCFPGEFTVGRNRRLRMHPGCSRACRKHRTGHISGRYSMKYGPEKSSHPQHKARIRSRVASGRIVPVTDGIHRHKALSRWRIKMELV